MQNVQVNVNCFDLGGIVFDVMIVREEQSGQSKQFLVQKVDLTSV